MNKMVSVLIIIVISLTFSAFFSGMEIAFVSSNKLKLEIDKKQSRTFGHIAEVFLRKPGQYISSILVGNNIALVIYSLNMTVLLNLIASRYGYATGPASIVLETLISTVIIIFTAEFLPKSLVRNNPNFYLRIFAVPLYLIYLILYPVARFSTWLSVRLFKLFGVRVNNEDNIRGFDRVDLAHMLEQVAENEKELPENEIKIFQNALDFSDLRVRNCMVPRVDIEAVDITADITELKDKFVQTSYSRIFVYDGSIDNIIGYVTTKSLFDRPASISEVLMDADYVPEALSAQKLLTLFIKKKRSVAVVIDEYGGTAGIVSVEDVLEEIFGEIEDEHDSQDMIERRIDDKTYIFSGRLEVDLLNEKYGLRIPESDEYDTLAGYIIYNHQEIPSSGETLTVGNMKVDILRTDASRIDIVKVTLL